MAKQLTQKFNKGELKRLVDDKNSCVTVHKSVYNLQLYPYHLTNISASIKEIINAKVAKYDQKLDGILLGYANLKLLTPQGSIMSDSCFIHIDIEGEFYLFKPEVDSLLTGVVNKKSVDHVGCLVHQLFNISVPSTEENWIGEEVTVGDEVVVKIVYMDLDSRLPYFKAELIKIKTKNRKKIKQVAEEDLGYQTEEISPKKKKKRDKIKLENSTIDEKDTSLKNIKQITENNVGFAIPTSKKKRKRDNEDDLDLQNDDVTPKKKNKRIKLENSIQVDSNTDEIDTSLKKKKKKVAIEETVDNIDLNLNKSIEKKKKKQKSEKNGPEESVKIDLKLNESNSKKKKKHKEEIKIDEVTNEIQEVVTKKKKKSELKEESTAASKLNLQEETTTTPEINLNDSTSKKKKRKSKEANIQENINGLSSEILMRPTEMIKEIIEKSPKKNRKSNEHKRKDSTVLHTPTVMADLEDRKHKKLNSSKNILWDNVELDLYDSELEQTLKEKADESSKFNLVKIAALNEGNDVDKKSEEKKKKKRKSGEVEMETKIKKEKLIFEDESTEQNIKKKSKTKKK